MTQYADIVIRIPVRPSKSRKPKNLVEEDLTRFCHSAGVRAWLTSLLEAHHDLIVMGGKSKIKNISIEVD